MHQEIKAASLQDSGERTLIDYIPVVASIKRVLEHRRQERRRQKKANEVFEEIGSFSLSHYSA